MEMIRGVIDRYILEVVWKKEYESFVDEFDGCSDKFEWNSEQNAEEDNWLYLRR